MLVSALPGLEPGAATFSVMGAMMSTSSQFEELLPLAVAGDRRSIERLLFAHYSLLESRIATRVPEDLKPALGVDDLLQETFLHAIRSLPRCEADSPRAFAAWLGSIADHLLVDAIRRTRCRKRGGDRKHMTWLKARLSSSWRDAVATLSDSAPTPGHLAAGKEALVALQSAIADLPQDERSVVELHWLQAKSLDETSRAIGRSPGAVRGLLHRAKRRLRTIMQSSSRWFDKR